MRHSQIEVVKGGGPYVYFGDGFLASCKPISESDLAKFMADCVRGDEDKTNKLLPIGGDAMPNRVPNYERLNLCMTLCLFSASKAREEDLAPMHPILCITAFERERERDSLHKGYLRAWGPPPPPLKPLNANRSRRADLLLIIVTVMIHEDLRPLHAVD